METISVQLQQTQKELLIQLELATQKLLETKKGLKGSDLVKDIEFEYRNDAFVLMALDYYTYVSEGRRPRARKVPIESLIGWIRDKGIPTRGRPVSEVAFMIQRSIYKNGIKGKNFELQVVELDTEIISEKLALDLSNFIVDDLVDALEQ